MASVNLDTVIASTAVAQTGLSNQKMHRDERHRRVLTDVRFRDYWEVAERADFYIWFYEQLLLRKFEVRWPLAAGFVATQAREGTSHFSESGIWLGVTSDTIQALLRRGNQVIFDDVLPKLNDLWVRTSPLTGQAAVDWDARALSEEQHLIQPIYAELSQPELARLRRLATSEGWFVRQGSKLIEDDLLQILNGPGRRQLIPEPFKGDIQSVDARWSFGMRIGASLSTLKVSGTIPPSPPAPGSSYLDGTALKKVDKRPKLHLFEALSDDPHLIMNDSGVRTRIVEALVSCSLAEQLLFLEEARFGARISTPAGIFPWLEFLTALATFRVDLYRQLDVLDHFRGSGGTWSFINYDKIRPMIQGAPTEQRVKIRGDRWKAVFVDVCDDATIVQAVDDLGITNPERQQWIDAETKFP